MKMALPCICFTVKEREIINKYGFLSYPAFLDNFYVNHRQKKYSHFRKKLKEHHENVEFAVAPDEDYELMFALKEKYPRIKWIFPMHKKQEFQHTKNFNWIGMPHRESFRDYSLDWFLRKFKNKNKWYLGFWAEKRPSYLLQFQGFDSALPETYAGKYGKFWLDWHSSKKANGEKTINIFEFNVKRFKKKVLETIKQQTVIASE